VDAGGPVVYLALVVLTLAVFGQVASHSFLNYDDDQFVTTNQHVLHPSLSWAFTSTELGWSPLIWLSHVLDVELFGLAAGKHLLMNVLLHAANACLLFAAMRRLTRATWPSAFVAALFAVHPAHVESVAWVAERKDTLSTLFALVALLLYARAPERKVGVAVAMALSLMSKTMYMTLPFVLLLLDVWPLERLRTMRDLRARVTEKLPLFALTVAGIGIAVIGQKNLHAFNPIPLSARVANALLAYAAYLRKLFIPTSLALPYPLRAVSTTAAIAAALLLIAITAAALFAWRRGAPWWAVGWFWFLGTLVPVIGLVQIGGQSMADRYTYFSYIGLFMAIAFGIRAAEAGRYIGPLIILVLAALSFRQTGFWKDPETLFTHAIAVTGDNPIAEYNLGQVLELKQPDASIEHLRRAIALTESELRAGAVMPEWYPQAYVGTATAMLMKARNLPAGAERETLMRESIALNRRALEIKPGTPHAVNNIALAQQMLAPAAASPANAINAGVALSQQGKMDEAIAQFRRAVEIAPQSVEARVYLALGLLQAGKHADGVATLRQAQMIDKAARTATSRAPCGCRPTTRTSTGSSRRIRGELRHGLGDGAAHRLVARHLRPPSERFHPRRGQTDFRHVAGPSARAAGPLDLHRRRIESHLANGPVGDLIDRGPIRDGQVVAVDLLGRVRVAEHHPVEAVLHVHVRLRLLAVAEDLQARRIALQLEDEVVDHAVRRKAADDVAEAEDPATDAVARRERGDQRLAGDLARRVQRDRKERPVLLGRRQHGRLAVNRAAAGEDELARLRQAHGLEQVVRYERAAFEIEVGVLGAEADVAVRREVPDAVGSNFLKERHQPLAVEQVEFVEVKVRHAGGALDVLALAEEEVVDAMDLVAVAQETGQEVGGDEAGGAGDDDLHACAPSSAARVRASSSGVPMS
jgi:tetratricopeptide (TPR) repeat protein